MKCARHTSRAKKDELLNLFGLGVEQAANHVVREAAALQEARALRLFLARGDRRAVLAREDCPGLLEITLGCAALDHRIGAATLLAILAALAGALLSRPPMRAPLGISLVRELPSLRPVVQHR